MKENSKPEEVLLIEDKEACCVIFDNRNSVGCQAIIQANNLEEKI